ncbi:MAG: hypothetical protein EDM05_62055 [Leptolyngbya sp. IPPAS B-1204]
MKRKQQGGLLPVAKFREILRLHELGYSQCQIAQSCAVARSTVQDYIRRATAKNLSYDQLRQLSDSEAQAALGKGRQKCEPREEPIDFAAVDAQLQHKGITLALLWQEGLDKRQWNCSYATFCRWYNQWRVRHQLSMRQVYKGGEKLFVDYCGLSVPVRDPETGTVTSAQIFVACLGQATTPTPKPRPRRNCRTGLGRTSAPWHFSVECRSALCRTISSPVSLTLVATNLASMRAPGVRRTLRCCRYSGSTVQTP